MPEYKVKRGAEKKIKFLLIFGRQRWKLERVNFRKSACNHCGYGLKREIVLSNENGNMVVVGTKCALTLLGAEWRRRNSLTAFIKAWQKCIYISINWCSCRAKAKDNGF